MQEFCHTINIINIYYAKKEMLRLSLIRESVSDLSSKPRSQHRKQLSLQVVQAYLCFNMTLIVCHPYYYSSRARV